MIQFTNALSTIYEDVNQRAWRSSTTTIATTTAAAAEHNNNASSCEKYEKRSLKRSCRQFFIVCRYVSADVVNSIDVHNSMQRNNEYFALHLLLLLLKKFLLKMFATTSDANVAHSKLPENGQNLLVYSCWYFANDSFDLIDCTYIMMSIFAFMTVAKQQQQI